MESINPITKEDLNAMYNKIRDHDYGDGLISFSPRNRTIMEILFRLLFLGPIDKEADRFFTPEYPISNEVAEMLKNAI